MPSTRLTGKSSDLLKVVLPAAARGDLKSVKRFVRGSTKWIHAVGPHGRTMLWEACYKKRLDTARYLIEVGADVNAAACYYTPLIVDLTPHAVAVRSGQEELAELLVENGATTDLHTAAYFGDVELMASFLAEHPEDVNRVYPGTAPRLLDASVAGTPWTKAIEKKLSTLESDLEALLPADLETCHERIESATRQWEIHNARQGCGTDFMGRVREIGDLVHEVIDGRHTRRTEATRRRLLLVRRHWLDRWTLTMGDRNPDPHVLRPIHYAVVGGQLETVELLIERGAEVAPHSKKLLDLAGSPSSEMFQRLVEAGGEVKDAVQTRWILDPELRDLASSHGVSLDWKDQEGKNPSLVRACTANMNAPDDPDRVLPILKTGAPVNIRDYKGKTALHRAAKAGFTRITQLLLDHGADLEAVDGDGETPIFEAVRHGRLTAVQLLLDAGANADVHNGKNTTLLTTARRGRKNEASEVRQVIEEAVGL